MRKILNKLSRAVKTRPLCAICILVIFSALIFEELSTKNEKQNIYLANAYNNFSEIGVFEGDIVTLVGTVSAMEEKDDGELQKLYVTLKNVATEKKEKITLPFQRIRVTMPIDAKVYMGQRICIRGNLSYYKKATNPGEFDLYEYYKVKGVLFKIYNGNIVYSYKGYSFIKQKLYELRLLGEKRIDNKLNKENAGIIKAMLFGSKGDIDIETKELFQKSGIAHILAISGLHISFLAITLFSLLKKSGLDTWICGIISESVLILYGIMIGFSVSSIRAIVMFSLYLLGKAVLRAYDMMTSMSFVLTIVILYNPNIINDTGLQLSFMAVLGVGYFYSTYVKKVLKPPKILSPLFVSLFVFLSTFPIILSSYYEIAFYSIALNLLIVPLMSVLLVVAILILTPFYFIGVPIVDFILWIYKESCIAFERIGIGRYNIGSPGLARIIMYYVLLVIAVNINIIWQATKNSDVIKLQFILANIKLEKKTLKPILFSFTIIFTAILVMTLRFPNNLHMWMVDVGQGDGMVIQNDNGAVYLIDGGSLSKKEIGKKCIIPLLKYYGINEIEAVFITHPDADHMNGIEELLERQLREHIRVRKIYIFEGFMENEGFADIFNKAQVSGTKIIGIAKGNIIENGKLKIEVLYPEMGYSVENINNASLVMNIGYKNFNMITTGDVEKEGEKLISEDEKINCDILKIAHHGSKSSTTTDFLEWTNPKLALISVGKNKYGHPTTQVLKRLEEFRCTIFRTDERGCIEIIASDGGYKCMGFIEKTS